MADFYYSYEQEQSLNSDYLNIYSSTLQNGSLKVFANENTYTFIEKDNDYVYLLGYAHTEGCTLVEYLSHLLNRFTIEMAKQVKKELWGQYLLIIKQNESIYIFSDILQTRSIYYDCKDKIVSSVFSLIHRNGSAEIDDYKLFEFISMRYCVHPSWLGKDTFDKRIKRIRANEVLRINLPDGNIQVNKVTIAINNTKESSIQSLYNETFSKLRKVIADTSLKDEIVDCTITGGFDSRLAMTLARNYYKDVNLRIAKPKGSSFEDYSIAVKIAKKLSKVIIIYETDIDKQESQYYQLTDGLSPLENIVMTELFISKPNQKLGIGGAFGTEIYTLPGSNSVDNYIHNCLERVKKNICAEDSYYDKLANSLRESLEYISNYYSFAERNDIDCIRLFFLLHTAQFNTRFSAGFNLFHRQFEPFGTYPVIEMAFRIPYSYMGGANTLGRYYYIPKRIMYKLDPTIACVLTNRFYPMAPLNWKTLPIYLKGKYLRKKQKSDNKPIKKYSLKTKGFQCNEYWIKPLISVYGLDLSNN